MALVSGRGTWIAKGVHVTTWPNGLQSGTFTAQCAPNLPDKTVQVYGTFGAGGTIAIHGSNDDTATGNYVVLTDPQGNNVSFTATGIETIMENVRFIKPVMTSGDGTTDVTIKLVSQSLQR